MNDPQLVTALVGAAFGGLAGAAVSGGLTWWVARRQREHERSEAREARRQARYEQTYVDVLEYTFLIEDFVNRTEPFFKMEGDPEPPTFPGDSEQRKLNARAAVFASPAVREKLKALSAAAREFQVAAWRVKLEREGRSTPADGEVGAWKELGERRETVRRIHAELIELANAELDARSG